MPKPGNWKRGSESLPIPFPLVGEKGVGAQKGDEEGLHPSLTLAIRLVGCLQHRCVIQCFVAPHPLPKCMAGKDLLHPLAPREPIKQFKGVRYLAIKGQIPGINDLSGSIDGLIQLPLTI